MSEIQANFVVEPITAQIVYSTGQINFTPTTNQLTISTGSAPAAAAPLMSIQYNENGLLAGDGAFYYFNDIVFQPNINVSGYSTLNYANITYANLSNVTNMRANVANVHITGGQNGYILQTDGLGNLAWYPENTGTLRVNIKAVSNANPMIMTVANTTPYINAAKVSITGVLGANANTVINGQDFYVKLSNNYATSGNVSLFTDANLSVTANGFGLTAVANTGIATTFTNTGNTGNGSPGGANAQIQYNDSGLFAGNAGFSFDSVSGNLSVPGNVSIVGNVVVASISGDGSQLSSLTGANVTGTVPLATRAIGADSANTVAGANVSGTVANATFALNAGNAYSVAAGNITGQVANALVAGTIYTNAQPNITSVGTLTSLSVSGNINSGNLSTSGNINSGNLSTSGNANLAILNLKKFTETSNTATLSGTISPDVANNTMFTYTLNGNIVFNGLTNAVAGSSATIVLIQDAIGGRTMTSSMLFAGGQKSLSGAANSKDAIFVFYNGTNYYASLTKGYS